MMIKIEETLFRITSGDDQNIGYDDQIDYRTASLSGFYEYLIKIVDIVIWITRVDGQNTGYDVLILHVRATYIAVVFKR